MALKKKLVYQTDLSQDDLEKILGCFLNDHGTTHSGFTSGRYFKIRRAYGKGLSYASPAVILGEITSMPQYQQVSLTVKIKLALLWKIFLTLFYSLLIFLAREILPFGRQKGVSVIGIIIFIFYLAFPMVMILNEARKDLKTIKLLLKLIK